VQHHRCLLSGQTLPMHFPLSHNEPRPHISLRFAVTERIPNRRRRCSYSIIFTVCLWGYVWYSSIQSPVRLSEIVIPFVSAFLPSLIAGAVVWSLRLSLAADLQPFVAVVLLGLIFLVTYLSGAALTAENRTVIGSAMASVNKLRSSKLVPECVEP